MKKLLFAGAAMLSALNAWAVTQQTYTDPDSLPESFEWEMVRYDYYKESSTAEPVLVNTQNVEVIWEPDYVNEAGSYGRLTLKNFYNHSRLANVCNLVFDNKNHNCNFQWKDNYTKCEFSLTAYNFSEASNTNSTNASGAKYAFLADAKYNTSGSRYWTRLPPEYATYPTSRYAYGGGTLSFEIDIVNKTLTILNQNGWGVFMFDNRYGSPPSYVLEAFALSTFELKPPTTLAWIEENGVLNETYTVADELVGVYAQGGSLWCKDQGNISIEKTTNPGNVDYMKRLIASMYNIEMEWDQSNWVELDFGTVSSERAAQIQSTYVGQVIKPGSIKGTYADTLNHRIVVSVDPEAGRDSEYTPNYYCPVNFMDVTEITSPNHTYYFLNPKVQEFAVLTMAVWKGDNVFVVPAKDETQGVNTADFSGAFAVNWGLNCVAEEDVAPYLSTTNAYQFEAILRRNLVSAPSEAPLREISVTGKDVEPNPKYVVYPLNLTANNVVTEITDVHSNREIVGDGYYYNLAGQRVTNPTPGFYIHNGKKVIVR